MADFRTHVGFSTVVGIGYGAGGFWLLGLPAPACVLAGGLCGFAGMLPDLDSSSGVPVRELVGFTAAIMPMLMLERLRAAGLAPETIVLGGAGVYLFVRFLLGTLIRKLTVHRGMFHSLPAALIAGLATFLLCHGSAWVLRLVLAGAVVLGYLSHLVLDELWSIQLQRGRLRLKSSFGTALSIAGPSMGANAAAYGLLILLGALTIRDAAVVERFGPGSTAPAIAAQPDSRWK